MDTNETVDIEAARAAKLAEMGAPVETLQEDAVVFDYFAFSKTHRVYLPDGAQYFEHKVLNEGDRRKYLNSTNRDVTLNQRTGEAKLRTAPGDEDRKSTRLNSSHRT